MASSSGFVDVATTTRSIRVAPFSGSLHALNYVPQHRPPFDFGQTLSRQSPRTHSGLDHSNDRPLAETVPTQSLWSALDRRFLGGFYDPNHVSPLFKIYHRTGPAPQRIQEVSHLGDIH